MNNTRPCLLESVNDAEAQPIPLTLPIRWERTTRKRLTRWLDARAYYWLSEGFTLLMRADGFNGYNGDTGERVSVCIGEVER